MTFRKSKGQFFYCLFMTTLVVIFFVMDVSRRGLGADNFFVLFMVLFLLISAFYLLVLSADITVNDDGFHRSLFGRKLFSSGWDDISLISDRMVPSPAGGGKHRFITLVLRTGFPRRAFATGLTRLDEHIAGFPDFIRALNTELKKHNIPVELSRNGKTVMQEEILLRIPEG